MFGDPGAGTDGAVETDGAVDAATVEAGEVGGKDGEQNDEGAASKKVTVPAAEYFGLVEKSKRLKDIEGEVERNRAEQKEKAIPVYRAALRAMHEELATRDDVPAEALA